MSISTVQVTCLCSLEVLVLTVVPRGSATLRSPLVCNLVVRSPSNLTVVNAVPAWVLLVVEHLLVARATALHFVEGILVEKLCVWVYAVQAGRLLPLGLDLVDPCVIV